MSGREETTSAAGHAGSRGTTLLELLVALFLISLGVLATAPMFVYALESNAIGSDIGQTGTRAAARMESLRALPFTAPELAPGGALDANVTKAGLDYFDTSDPDYVVRWVVADHPGLAGTRDIAVRAIALHPAVGQAKQVTLVTVRGK